MVSLFLRVILSFGDSNMASFSPTTLYVDIVLIKLSVWASTFEYISFPCSIMKNEKKIISLLIIFSPIIEVFSWFPLYLTIVPFKARKYKCFCSSYFIFYVSCFTVLKMMYPYFHNIERYWMSLNESVSCSVCIICYLHIRICQKCANGG